MTLFSLLFFALLTAFGPTFATPHGTPTPPTRHTFDCPSNGGMPVGC